MTARTKSIQVTRVGRVRVIFRIPATLSLHGLIVPTPSHWPRDALAYVQWYKAPTLSEKAARSHKMPSLTRAYMSDGITPQWSIVPVLNIRQSVHLTPDFAKVPESDWDIPTSRESVLDTCKDFLLNNWLSLYTYQTVYMA